MKICIVGAGAIGGMLGVKLALTGNDVTLILRGANLEAVKANGLTLIEENGNELVAKPIKATSVIAEAGVQDVIILALKAHQVSAVAADLPALMHAGTRVVTMQNGITVVGTFTRYRVSYRNPIWASPCKRWTLTATLPNISRLTA
jgi:2-dehydropantoate 2-reductase